MNVFTIARKELSIYFTTVVGYAGFGAFAFLLGLLFIKSLNDFQIFTTQFLQAQRPEMLERLNFNDMIITPMLSTGMWMFLFFIPFLTMRLFAEEKQNRTFELLMTAPVTSLEIVLGKFIGVGFMVVIMNCIALIFPFILDAYGTSNSGSPVEWTPVWSGFLFLILLGLTFCAVGILVSALTESQIIAALLTFAVLLLGYVLPLLAGRLEGDWRAVVEYLTPVSHVLRGLQGRVLLADLVYFGSAIGTLLFLTHRVVESHRWR